MRPNSKTENALQKQIRGARIKKIEACKSITVFDLITAHASISAQPIKLVSASVARMRRPTGDQEVAGSTPAEVGNILS